MWFCGTISPLMNTSSINNLAAYRFIDLTDLESLQGLLLSLCERHHLMGTILLSPEGINLILAGPIAETKAFMAELSENPLFCAFSNLHFKESISENIPFKRLRVRLKKEIITLKKDDIKPLELTGAPLSPEHLRQWLDEKKDFVLLDTRNDYEVEMGTFKNAITLPINTFSEFPSAIAGADLPKDKPIVMFCTGGVRCEKASSVMMKLGYDTVYQLDGGILDYFKECNDAHYEGNCFVFDERTAITPTLAETGMTQCVRCDHFLTPLEQRHPDFIRWKSCQFCESVAEAA
jgi:UPF0176 protein